MADQTPNHVAIQIGGKLAKAEPLLTTECCIYRVPHEIRKFNNDAYTPKVISIGPFHYGNQRLRNMESRKLIYCKRFIERAETSLNSLVSCVQESEPKVRRCYSESINLSAEKFVELLLVDCCFIFELFLTDDFHEVTDDDTISLEGSLGWIAHDLLLLENQLPFFIIDKLYTRAFPSSLNNNPYPSFVNLICNYFKKFSLQVVDPPASMKHFTDLLRISYLPPPHSRPARTYKLARQIYSATDLIEAGVQFRVKRGGHSLLDLKFSGHYLEIPKLYVVDSTEILFRNMMALEQFHYLNESYITDYVVFLDYLINTSNDVDILVRKGIITNLLGDNIAVAKLFNGLGKNITCTSFNSDYSVISKELREYCKHPLNSAMATLRRDYWRTPWQIAASIAAIVLLILTVIQTVCSILQVLQV